jgi:phytoene desaturase
VDRIVHERIFTVDDFRQRYHAYEWTALGIAHTFRQTAIFRPNNVSKKVAWLYYAWAYTNPGIGMPMCLISGKLAYERIKADLTD